MPTPDSDLRVTLGLTLRQTEVALWVTEGRSTQEIAAIGDMSVATVRRHLEAIFRRTGCHSRAQLVALVLSVRFAERGDRDAMG